MPSDLKEQARKLALRAARAAAAVLFGLVGAGFLIAAAWQAIADALSPMEANCILGAAFAAVGFAAFFWPKKKPKAPQVEVGANDLLQVFLTGLNTGRSIR